MRNRLEEVARKMLGEDDLQFADEEVALGSPSGETALLCSPRQRESSPGRRHGGDRLAQYTTGDVDRETGQGNAYSNYSYATQLAEVEVDTETGKVKVLRVIASTDVGKAINPLNVVTQIEGGVVMGMGYGLTEEVRQERGYVERPGTLGST